MLGSIAESSRLPAARVLTAQRLIEVVRGVVADGGALWIRVTGISMNPGFREGDSVLLAKLARQPRRGDVVFLDVAGTPLLHRVRRNDGGRLTTRGDAAMTDDAPVSVAACVAHALAVRRGTVTIALLPTLRLGVAPLLWRATWEIRVRLPALIGRRVKPLSRALVRALS